MHPTLRLSALELGRRIRSRELSPTEVVDTFIRRIEAVNPALNAVVADRFEAAREEARQAEARLMRTAADELPAFFGVPCTIKEFYGVTGMPQTGGLWRRKREVAGEDAEVVRRVRAAGAIVLGVTNVPEGGLWLETDNRVYGRSNNPWDTRRTPGGSSGGEGAIVAAGGSAFGMGSDIGGSIRLPAAFCGVAGHKPSGRLVPNAGHWPPLSGELQAYLACGPIARSVDDLMGLMRVIAGEAWPSGEDELDLRDVTVHPVEHATTRPQPSQLGALRRATRALEARGARIERLPADLFEDALWIWGAMMSAVGDTSYAELVSGNPDLSVARELLRNALRGGRHTAPVLMMIIAERVMKRLPSGGNRRLIEAGRALARRLEETLGDRGVILHPPYARPAPYHRLPLLRPLDGSFTPLCNVLELPSTQVPIGLDELGLPLGVQVIGARGRDRLCLSVARAIEAEVGALTPIDPRARAVAAPA